MPSKRRATKPAATPPEEPSRDSAAAVPAPGWLERVLARLKTLKGAIVAIAGVGAVLGGLAGYWNAYQAARGSTQSAQLLALVGKGDAGPLSIVVLPFANLTGDPQQAYVADGITAAVTADLSRIRDAFIVSTATAFAYKDKPVTVQQIGKELGVHFALQGGVQHSGDTIRINAQLADTTSNAQLWSESFDGSQSDLFTLQEMVTTRIGNSIGDQMIVMAVRESETRKGNPRAADLLLRARALIVKPVSLRNLEEQEALCRQALSLEPDNVQAMVRLALFLSMSAQQGFIKDPALREERLIEARDLALKAKDVDPGIANIYVTLGIWAQSQGDYEGARRAAETGVSLEPKEPIRYSNLADDYRGAGEPAKAIELLTKAIRLDPRNVRDVTLRVMGRVQFMLGDNEAAIEWMLKAIDANPGHRAPHAYLAMAYARKGNHARSRAAIAALLRVDPNFSLSKLDAPRAGYPADYREFWETKLLPAGRLAGLPE